MPNGETPRTPTERDQVPGHPTPMEINDALDDIFREARSESGPSRNIERAITKARWAMIPHLAI